MHLGAAGAGIPLPGAGGNGVPGQQWLFTSCRRCTNRVSRPAMQKRRLPSGAGGVKCIEVGTWWDYEEPMDVPAGTAWMGVPVSGAAMWRYRG